MRLKVGPAGALVLLISITAGCDDPTRPLPVPPQSREMAVFAVLDPTESSQPVWIEAVEVGPPETIEGLRTEVWAADTLLMAVIGRGSMGYCSERYGALGSNSAWGCPLLPFRPQPGRTYRVVIRADERPAASAVVRVPGDFQVIAAAGQGNPPGTAGLQASWTRSGGVYRYVVALRSQVTACEDIHGCEAGWFVTTADTSLTTWVPEDELEPSGTGTWFLDVYAMDQGLFDYLTSGTFGEFFSVPPASNVEGGYGVIGAWVRRSVNLTH